MCRAACRLRAREQTQQVWLSQTQSSRALSPPERTRREELTAAPSEGPAGLSSCSPGLAGAPDLAQSDSHFPLQVTAKSAAPSTLLALICQDIQQKREFATARGELSWRKHLSAQVGLERVLYPSLFWEFRQSTAAPGWFDGSQEQKVS